MSDKDRGGKEELPFNFGALFNLFYLAGFHFIFQGHFKATKSYFIIGNFLGKGILNQRGVWGPNWETVGGLFFGNWDFGRDFWVKTGRGGKKGRPQTGL